MSKVKPGIEVFLSEYASRYAGKHIGLITNPTGVDSQLRSTADLLFETPGLKLTALYGPEHGIRGDIFAGEHIANETDRKTGLPVFSLYGATRKPTPEMLEGIDVFFFDIQDVGARYYTFIYTMAYAMEAARDKGIEFVVFDRPNPITGTLTDGPVLDTRFSSFIGLYPIPIVHGLTVGELARLFNEEFGIGCQLTVIPMEGWHREMDFSQTGLPWILTSPQIPQASVCWHYVITGFIGELLSLSTGVGYTLPFEIIGAPFIHSDNLAAKMNRLNLPGILFRPLTFRPWYFKFKDEPCGGVQIHITDTRLLRPIETGLHLFATLLQEYPDAGIMEVDESRMKMFHQALGTDAYDSLLKQGTQVENIIEDYKRNLNIFNALRHNYFLYPQS